MARFEDPTPERPVPCGRYELIGRLGAGGMAEVFRARLKGPADFSKTVVIKRILPQLARDPLMVRMFVEEARIAAAADHDNIATVFELDRTDKGQYFIVMELIDGIDLEQLLEHAAKRGLRVPTWFTVHVAAMVLEALSYVHGLVDERGRPRNVIHRDATPSNVFISHLGQVKLSDFGVADFAGKSPTTQAGQLKGKIAYMSPEQLRAKPLDQRADVFSVGVLLWEALTQERLFGHLSEMRAMMAICDEERPLASSRLPTLPPRLDDICNRALALDRDRRYPTAEAFQTELLEVLHELRPPVRPRDVRAVLEELAGRRPPAAETSARAPRPQRDASFLVPVSDLMGDVADPGPDTLKAERQLPPGVTPPAAAPARPASSLPAWPTPSAPARPAPSGPAWPTPSTPTRPAPSNPARPAATPAPDLDVTDSDMLATVDEGQDPAIAMEVEELRALMAAQQVEVEAGPPTEPVPKVTPPKPEHPIGVAQVQMELSGDQTLAGDGLEDPAARAAPIVFRVRTGGSRAAVPLGWSETATRARAAAEAGTAFEVAVRGEDFVDRAELGRLTGLDLDYQLDPPSNVTVVGQLAKRSLTATLARLGVDRATGVLTVARPSDGAWFELEIHQGRPSKLVSPLASTHLPDLLVAHTPLTPTAVEALCGQAVAERRPVAQILRETGGPDLSPAAFHRLRLQSVFGWTEGDYTFNEDRVRPQARTVFAPSLLALLPELVAATRPADALLQALQPVFRRPLHPDPKLISAQAGFTAEQRAQLARLVDTPVERALPPALPARHATAALAITLVESGLAS